MPDLPRMATDAAWLSSILGADVLQVHAETLGVFSSEVSRLQIAYQHDVDLPTSLILKCPHPDRQARVGESFATEGRFYRELADQLDVRLPQCWAESNDYILLEDVDYQPFDWHAGATVDHAQAAIDALRRVHACTAPPAWVANFADANLRRQLAQKFDHAWSSNRARFDRLIPAFTAVGDTLKGGGHEFLSALGNHQALLQGDAHLENLPLLAAEEGVVIFDWQGPRVGHGLFDVAYFLVMSQSPQQRQHMESQMHEYYLGHAPTEEERTVYGLACVARGAGIVELTADWRPQQFDDDDFNWVFERCLQGAVDHADTLGRRQ